MDSKYGINNINQFSRLCYYIGLGIGFIGIVIILLIKCLKIDIIGISPFGGCLSKYGFYCFGCGGTRAAAALLKGELFESLYYHPAVLYIAAVYIIYMLSHSLNIITNGRVRYMLFCPCYFYVAMAIIIGQCIIKNILLYCYGFIL